MKLNNKLLLLAFLLCISSFKLHANVSVPNIFNNDMVIQADESISIWGTANPNERVSVSLGTNHGEIVTDDNGFWKVNLKKMKYGRNSNNADQEIQEANLPNIRFFQVPLKDHKEEQNTIDAKWEVCSPMTVKNKSAVGYFFGKRLNQD